MRLMGLSVAYLCIGIPLAFYSAALNVWDTRRYSDYSWIYMHSAVRPSRMIYRLRTVTHVPTPAFFAVVSFHGPHLGGPVRRKLRELEQRHRRFLLFRGLRLWSGQHGDVHQSRSAVPSICEIIEAVSRFGRASKVRARFHVASASRRLEVNLWSVSVSPSDSRELFRERFLRVEDIGQPNSSRHPTRLAGTSASAEESKSWWKKSVTLRSLERIHMYYVRDSWSAAARTVTRGDLRGLTW